MPLLQIGFIIQREAVVIQDYCECPFPIPKRINRHGMAATVFATPAGVNVFDHHHQTLQSAGVRVDISTVVHRVWLGQHNLPFLPTERIAPVEKIFTGLDDIPKRTWPGLFTFPNCLSQLKR